MNKKDNIRFKINFTAFNSFATLILGLASLFISYNSYRLSEKQSILEEGQQKLELKNAILELINTSSMLRQTEKSYPNIENCIETFGEIKNILEGQLKNKFLFENHLLAKNWTELLMRINFNIKFFQPGTSPNVKIDGASEVLTEIENASLDLFKIYNQEPNTE